MSSESSVKAELSEELHSLNIGSDIGPNDKEKEGDNNDIDTVITALCAACGKEDDWDNMNACNKCDLVKYCNAACKKKHRHKHKKKCEKRAAEWHDEQLFKDHPPREDCPICMLPLPADSNQTTFHSCCGKLICNGCQHAIEERKGGDLCAFCRTPNPESNEKEVERTRKQMEKGNAYATCPKLCCAQLLQQV